MRFPFYSKILAQPPICHFKVLKIGKIARQLRVSALTFFLFFDSCFYFLFFELWKTDFDAFARRLFFIFFIAKRDKNLECGRDAVAILIQEKNKPKKDFFFKFFLNKNHKNFKRSNLKSFGTSLTAWDRSEGSSAGTKWGFHCN